MSRITVQKVYWVTEGSALLADITSGSPATGGSLQVEAVTDFDVPSDGETRTALIDLEQITYTGIDETLDTLTGITRGANSTTPASHTAGTFVQDGVTPAREKFADGFIDDDEKMNEGVEILRHLWRYYPQGARDHEEMEVASIKYLADYHQVKVYAPDDEDKAVEPVIITWSKAGEIDVSVRPHQFPAPFGGTIEEVRMAMGEGGEPTGASVIVDILKDGVSILTTKVTVPAGAAISAAVEPTTKEVRKGDLLQVEFEQVGSTLPGSDPTLYLTLFPSENAIAGRIEVPGEQGIQGVAGTNGTNGTNGADGVISEVQNEGSALTDAATMDFVGAGVGVTSNGTKYTVDVPGGGVGDHGASAYKTGTQVIGNNAWTAVTLTAELYDTDAYHDNSTNPSRFTVPSGRAGRYTCHLLAPLESNATGLRGIGLYKNAAQLATDTRGAVNGANTHMSLTVEVDLAVGDYVEMFVYQNSGGNLNTNGFSGTHYLNMTVRQVA